MAARPSATAAANGWTADLAALLGRMDHVGRRREQRIVHGDEGGGRRPIDLLEGEDVGRVDRVAVLVEDVVRVLEPAARAPDEEQQRQQRDADAG